MPNVRHDGRYRKADGSDHAQAGDEPLKNRPAM